MKKFTRFGLLIAFLSISSLGFAQSTIDFETVGQTWTWTVFANGAGGGDNAAGITYPVANPATTGINTSANCLKFVEAPTAADYGGFFTINVGDVTITDATKIVKVMVYKSRVSNFKLKLEGLDFGGGTEFPGANTLVNQWEELSFDLTASIGKKFNKLVFLPDFTARTAEATIYIDNVKLPTVNPPVITGPTTAAAAPTHPVTNVISIYGTDTYTPITGVNALADWGQGVQGSTYTTYVIPATTHSVLKYGKLSFQGIDFTGNAQDVSKMKYLHMDIWTTDAAATPLWVGLIHVNENIAVSKTITTAGSWYGLDIPLTDYVGSTLTSINQLQFKSSEWYVSATNTLQKDIYVDNIYFWTDVTPTLTVSPKTLTIAQPAGSTKTFVITTAIGWTVASNQSWLTPTPASGTGNGTITLTATANGTTSARTATVTVTGADATTQTIAVTQDGMAAVIPAAPTPTIAAAKVISFFSDAYTNVTGIDFAPGWGQSTVVSDVSLGGNAAKKYTIFNYIGVDFAGNHQNASAMTTLHVDIYPTDETAVRITPISPGGHELPTALTPLVQNQWNSFDVPLSTYVGVILSDLFQFKFDGGTGKTFYMDNLYLYNGTVGISKIDNSDISIYPNPVKSGLFVNGLPQNATVKIFDQRGKLLVNRQNGNNQIDVSNLAKGVYIIQISGKNAVTTKKFIKE